jgi:CubicO group peptidase (beta-lactamase class C family)
MIDTRKVADGLKRAAESGDVPGVAATAATADGVIFEGAFGKRSLATGAAMTLDTVVWIASMTKALTAACAMLLVERGKLALDAGVADLAPQLRNVQLLRGFDPNGEPRLRPARRAITLRHLLTHTSGFAYEHWNADVVRYMEKMKVPGIATCTNAALTLPLIADPGERWEYGISIDWAGKVVEAASGQTLDKFMQENILDPLGMTDTGFKLGDSQRQRLAAIHSRKPEGLVTTDIEIPQNPEFHMGGGGVYSTVSDYLKFTQMIMHGGALGGVRVFKPETIAMMSRNAIGDLRCHFMKTSAPDFTNDVDFVEGMEWGLSFMINPTPRATGRSAGSLAWAGLANCYYWIDPIKKVTGVYATQVLPFYDAKSYKAYEAFETAIYQLS